MNIALNTPVKLANGCITEVAQSAATREYSFTVTGGTPSERREAALEFFETVGAANLENLDYMAVQRPWGIATMFFIRKNHH